MFFTYILIYTYIHFMDKKFATITAGGEISYDYTNIKRMQNVLNYYGAEYHKYCIYSITSRNNTYT
jgi:hypothetical protein